MPRENAILRHLIFALIFLIVLGLLLLPHLVHAQPITITQAPGYQQAQDEGIDLIRRRTIDFAGAGVSCADSGGKTVCTIAGGSGGSAPALLTYANVAALPAAASYTAAIAYVQEDGSYYYSDGASWTRLAFAAFLADAYSVTGTAKAPFFRVDATGGSATITLPADGLTGQGMVFFRTDTSGNTVTIAPASGTIDGGASITLASGEARIVSSDGSNVWRTMMRGRSDGLALGLRETSGPTNLTMGAVADGEYLRRSGTTIVSGSGGSGYATVQDEGTPLTQRATLNFIGSNINCVDDAGNTRTDCTITGGGSGLTLQETQIATIYGGL